MRVLIAENFSVKNEAMTLGIDLMEGYKSPYDSEIAERIKNIGEITEITKISSLGLNNNNEEIIKKLLNDEGDLGIALDSNGETIKNIKENGLIAFISSYGVISRYGIVATNETMDRIVLIAKDLETIKSAFEILKGHDEKDSTSYNRDLEEFENTNLKTGELEGGYIKHSNADFELLRAVEFASATARFDGVLYGAATKYDSLKSLFTNYRNKLDKDVKEEIFKGNFLLAKKNRNVYTDALKLRRLIRDEVKENFENLDLIKLKADEIILVNLTGYPALVKSDSVYLAKMYEDNKLLRGEI